MRSGWRASKRLASEGRANANAKNEIVANRIHVGHITAIVSAAASAGGSAI